MSLFTRVLVDLAIRVAQQRFEADTSLSERTCLSVETIILLLKLCLQATYFSTPQKTRMEIVAMPEFNDLPEYPNQKLEIVELNEVAYLNENVYPNEIA